MKRSRLCSICARGGSKGVKNKNIRTLDGKPLIGHIIETARLTGLFDAIAVSSDSEAILEAANNFGVDFLIQRPLSMATDEAPKLPAIQHCAQQVQSLSGHCFQTFVDLCVTAPLMLPEDVKGAIELLESSDAINVISATAAAHSPYFSVVEASQPNRFVKLVKKLDTPFARRQDCPPCYTLNGAIYAWKSAHFFELNSVITDKTLVYEMPAERSIDIDSEFDLDMATFLYHKRKNSARHENITAYIDE